MRRNVPAVVRPCAVASVALLLALLAGCAARSGWHHGETGDAVDGVRAMLVTDHPAWVRGKPIQLDVVLRNDSSAPVSVDRFPYMTLNWLHDGKPLADSIGNVTLAPNAIVLAPGEQRRFLLESMASRNLRPGRLSVSGHVGRFELPRLEILIL